ncbi:Metallo-hydrolase/oxidoreductase [Punctularia strigosozonata HHB-11173 SS5]|uniref:Metallo-hydrolase/oxidoreductase n=1 Tax=Punctularia strigosozonata (strain HHB-11173) TaxID=741275 RepID=UPI0004418430|nr:Metallo-hydrolase/oxidoreductase [Punctularia strigosozonata HHB-11173 SS5]EIN12835.1 Metallo-hydrolase/oxidoreductase [Punctularia strigosozonata HHB-11173 SS5]
MSLPSHNHQQTYCRVSALEAGILSIPLGRILQGGQGNVIVPSLSFILQRSSSKETVIFDLGICEDFQRYPESVTSRIQRGFQPMSESLSKGSVLPSSVDYVILSHLHWDHIGDPAPFSNATFIVGAESASMNDLGFPTSQPLAASEMLPKHRTRLERADTWTPLGPFPRAFDIFGDGSIYIVDAAGHCPGHINLLARTSADGGWIFLAGDSAHDRRLITGDGEMATKVGVECAAPIAHLHRDKSLAEAHIGRIARLMGEPRVRVLLAHDREWFEANVGGPSFWPGIIPTL